jgi:hypothetical protein
MKRAILAIALTVALIVAGCVRNDGGYAKDFFDSIDYSPGQ